MSTLFIVYLVQHLLFIILRPLLLISYCFVCGCLDQGQPFTENDNLNNCIISFNYIEHWTEKLDFFKER